MLLLLGFTAGGQWGSLTRALAMPLDAGKGRGRVGVAWALPPAYAGGHGQAEPAPGVCPVEGRSTKAAGGITMAYHLR